MSIPMWLLGLVMLLGGGGGLLLLLWIAAVSFFERRATKRRRRATRSHEARVFDLARARRNGALRDLQILPKDRP